MYTTPEKHKIRFSPIGKGKQKKKKKKKKKRERKIMERIEK